MSNAFWGQAQHGIFWGSLCVVWMVFGFDADVSAAHTCRFLALLGMTERKARAKARAKGNSEGA